MSNSKTKGFLVYYEHEVIVCRLTDDEAGKLFKALFPYAKERIRPADFEVSPALAMAFDILGMAIDQNKEWYDQKCETNRANALKRWNTNAYERMPNNAVACEWMPNKDKIKDKDKNKINGAVALTDD